MDDSIKIYGLCLERLKGQIRKARSREAAETRPAQVILESYNTGDLEEIVDILELYDLEEKTPESLKEKLADLAYTVSVLTGEALSFSYDEDGHLALCLLIYDRYYGEARLAIHHSS